MYYMQLVTPSEVQSAVSTVTMTCRIVFQVSFFIFFIPFFLVNNPVSVSGIPPPCSSAVSCSAESPINEFH